MYEDKLEAAKNILRAVVSEFPEGLTKTQIKHELAKRALEKFLGGRLTDDDYDKLLSEICVKDEKLTKVTIYKKK